MVRRVRLAFIENEAARRAEYNRRRRDLMRELDELSAECRIEACAIVRRPDDPQVEIMLSQQRVQRFISSGGRPEEVVQTTNEETDEETYLKERIAEAKELLKQTLMKNEREEKTLRMYQCLKTMKLPENLSSDELNEMAMLIDQEMKGIEQIMAQMMSDQSGAAVESAATVDGGEAENKGKGPMEDGDGGQGLE